MAVNQQSDLKNKAIIFDPPPLKITKKGKKAFQLIIILFWLSAATATGWQLSRSQSSSNSLSKDDQNILPIIQSDGQSTGNTDIRLDEILGSKRFEEPTGNDQSTGNPMKANGSVEKLLEGKEIVIPQK